MANIFSSLPRNYIISFFGKPGSGKSHAIKYFLSYVYARKLVDVVIVFTNTANNGFYQEFIDNKYVMMYNEKKLIKVWEAARRVAPQRSAPRGSLGTQILLIFDDILGSINFNAPIWNEIAANHRHNNVSMLIASQSMTKLPVYVRDYSNYAVIFYQTTTYARRNAYVNFGEDFGTSREFTDYLNVLPKHKHAFIFVDTVAAERAKKYSIMCCPEKIAKFFFHNYITG